MADKEPSLDDLKAGLELAGQGRAPDTTYKTQPRPKRRRRKYMPGEPKNGGWRGSPSSLAVLDLHRKGTQFGGPNMRVCQRHTAKGLPCTNPAVRGLDVCRSHGGRPELTARQKLDPAFRPKRAVIWRKQLHAMLQAGTFPPELLREPTFLAVARIAAQPREHCFTGTSRDERRAALRRWNAALRVSMALSQAWVAAVEQGDGRLWADAVAEARREGLLPS